MFFLGFLSVVVSNRLLFMFGSFQVFIVCIFYDDITLMGDCHLGNSNYSYDVNCPANLASPGLFLLCYRDMHHFLRVGPPRATLFTGVNCISVFLLF